MDPVHVPAASVPARTASPETRPSRPLIVAVPYAAWLCWLGAPAALFAR
jgi:hypothetical protein